MEATRRRILSSTFQIHIVCPLRPPLLKSTPRDLYRTIHTTSPLHASKPNRTLPKKPPRPVESIFRTPPRKPLPSTSSPESPPPPKTLNKGRGPALVLSGLLAALISAYSSYLYLSLRKTPSSPASPSQQTDFSHRYDSIARTFDEEVEWTEWVMGLLRKRKKLVGEARGDVLEASVGTGRNLGFFEWDFKGFNGVGKPRSLAEGGRGIKRGKVKSYTAVDTSIEMLEVAHEKFSEMFPGVVGVRWVVADATKDVLPPPPVNSNVETASVKERAEGRGKEGYDTVIQTMGLCSVSDPVALLRNLGRCVKEEEGRILLLEHGRGRWEWLNGVLDKTAGKHAEQFGCWWNRDLGAIVEGSGLEVVRCEKDKWLGGTNWVVELRRPRGWVFVDVDAEEGKEGDGAKKLLDEKGGEKVEVKGKKGWW